MREERTQLLNHGQKGNQLNMGPPFRLPRSINGVKGPNAQTDGLRDGLCHSRMGDDKFAKPSGAGRVFPLGADPAMLDDNVGYRRQALSARLESLVGDGRRAAMHASPVAAGLGLRVCPVVGGFTTMVMMLQLLAVGGGVIRHGWTAPRTANIYRAQGPKRDLVRRFQVKNGWKKHLV